MAIGCCDACDAQDVPGSRCGSDVCTDGFFCFLCQGDEFDPYEEASPVTLDDLEERDEDESEQSKARTAEAMAMFDETIAMIKHWVEAV